MKNIVHYCLSCEIESRRRKGEYTIRDPMVDEDIWLCKKHYDEYKQIQQLLEDYGSNYTENRED